jgi:hypothetical protein
VALADYEQHLRRYQHTAKLFSDDDRERRQHLRELEKLSRQEVALTERVKRRLLREHPARAGDSPRPFGETNDQRAQRLLDERYSRESTERAPSPPPRSRFDIRKLLPDALLQSLRAPKQLRSEHSFAALRNVQRSAADIRIRMITLNTESAAQRVNTRIAFDAIARAFENVTIAVSEAGQRRHEMGNGHRLELRKLQAFVASTRKRFDAGRARFDAHGIEQQDQPALRSHYKNGIQPDGAALERPSRRTHRGTAGSSTLHPQQREDHPLLERYGLRSSREPSQTLPPPGRRSRSR